VAPFIFRKVRRKRRPPEVTRMLARHVISTKFRGSFGRSAQGSGADLAHTGSAVLWAARAMKRWTRRFRLWRRFSGPGQAGNTGKERKARHSPRRTD